MKVAVAGLWKDGVLRGPIMGQDVGEGLGRPTPLQLYAAAAVLEGLKMAGSTVLSLKQVTVPGQRLAFVWPDERDVNGVVFEIGEGVSMLERVALAGQLKFLAAINMQGQLQAQALKLRDQIIKPNVAIPGGVRVH